MSRHTCHRFQYIIKPALDYKHLRFRSNIPTNKHLTVQIANQVYKIKTAENAYVATWQVKMSQFCTLVIFNYLFYNGDAHLKNFPLQETPEGIMC